jgi:hypothetical protein
MSVRRRRPQTFGINLGPPVLWIGLRNTDDQGTQLGIGVCLAARDGEALRLGLQAAWVSARRLLTGAAPPSRRKGGGASAVPVLT